MQSPIEYLRERYGYNVLLFFRTLGPAAFAMLLLFYLPKVMMCFESERYQQTTATVESSSIERFKQRLGVAWIISLQYSYDVAGKEYFSELYDPFGPCHLRLHSSASSHIENSAVLGPFRQGTQMTVWYDPSDPSRAVLRNGREVLKNHVTDLALVPVSLIVTIILWRIPSERYKS